MFKILAVTQKSKPTINDKFKQLCQQNNYSSFKKFYDKNQKQLILTSCDPKTGNTILHDTVNFWKNYSLKTISKTNTGPKILRLLLNHSDTNRLKLNSNQKTAEQLIVRDINKKPRKWITEIFSIYKTKKAKELTENLSDTQKQILSILKLIHKPLLINYNQNKPKFLEWSQILVDMVYARGLGLNNKQNPTINIDYFINYLLNHDLLPNNISVNQKEDNDTVFTESLESIKKLNNVFIELKYSSGPMIEWVINSILSGQKHIKEINDPLKKYLATIALYELIFEMEEILNSAIRYGKKIKATHDRLINNVLDKKKTKISTSSLECRRFDIGLITKLLPILQKGKKNMLDTLLINSTEQTSLNPAIMFSVVQLLFYLSNYKTATNDDFGKTMRLYNQKIKNIPTFKKMKKLELLCLQFSITNSNDQLIYDSLKQYYDYIYENFKTLLSINLKKVPIEVKEIINQIKSQFFDQFEKDSQNIDSDLVDLFKEPKKATKNSQPKNKRKKKRKQKRIRKKQAPKKENPEHFSHYSSTGFRYVINKEKLDKLVLNTRQQPIVTPSNAETKPFTVVKKQSSKKVKSVKNPFNKMEFHENILVRDQLIQQHIANKSKYKVTCYQDFLISKVSDKVLQKWIKVAYRTISDKEHRSLMDTNFKNSHLYAYGDQGTASGLLRESMVEKEGWLSEYSHCEKSFFLKRWLDIILTKKEALKTNDKHLCQILKSDLIIALQKFKSSYPKEYNQAFNRFLARPFSFYLDH
ncbi:hypothetical protein DID75_04525 [Candidatus Marinamargulisbacteria bacterium SCGC AG-410-N11]|nr:hypothetical protein DID75_04525 [Candidatus Marinamargulisbacteria bacterium SCGC AG-410-N11]